MSDLEVQIDDGPLTEGQVLDGKYRIESVLARAGMGIVYRAHHLSLDRPVAIKCLLAESLAEEGARARFRREAQVLAKLESPHVVRVFDVGDLDGERPYVVMELLRGEDLLHLMRRERRLSVGRACDHALQAAKGLAAAHAAGVIHRDVKPSNLFVVRDADGRETVKLIDFGIAKVHARQDPDALALTQRDSMVGSPRYMSPEQIEGAPSIDARADVWSLAVVLQELLTGTPLFGGESKSGLLVRILTRDAPSLLERVPDAPPLLAEALRRALQRDPSSRTPDVRTFARDIAPFAEASSGPGAAEVDVPAFEAPAPDLERTSRSTPGRRGAGASTHHVPAESDAFVGRRADLEALGRTLRGGARLVSVLGIGGTGKTRLVTRFGWESLGEWPGGVWFCDLSDARSVEGIAFAVAGVLGVPLGKEDPISQLGNAIAGRGRCLLVLDNFEQITREAPATVGRWLERAPDARFLVTSREVLGLPGEQTLPLDPLGTEEAVELFRARAAAVMPTFSFLPDELDTAEALVRLLDNLPLAIELAAARVRVMPLPVLLQRMSARFKLLASTGGRRARQATLRSAIDWSWDLLSEDERAALGQLSVFDGGFTLEAAEAVLELDALWAVDAVQALVDKSLVRRVGPSRFGLLVSVQEYAAEKLDASGRRAAAEARHGLYFAQFGLEPALDALDRHGGLARRSALTLEIDNLAAASLRAVARRDVETALHTALAAWAVLVTRGPYHFGVTVLEIAREIMPPRSAARAALLNALGDAVQLAGDSPAATACLEEARDLCRSFGDRRGEAHAINLLSVVSWQRGRPDEAIVLGEEALALCREIDAPLIESRVLGNLGAAAFLQGRLEEARARNEAAIAIDRALGNQRAEGSSFGNLGIVLSLQGRFDEARAQFEAALVLHRALGSRREEGIALANLGQLLRQQGDLEGALTNCREAVLVNRQIGNRRIEGVALGELGAVHVAAGRRVEALECLSQAEAVLRSVHDRYQLCLVLASRAICEAPVDPARAMRDLAEAEACAAQLGDLPDSELRQRIAEAREALGAD